MPKPVCVQCSANDSLLWRTVECGQICYECHLNNGVNKTEKNNCSNEKDENDDKKEIKEEVEVKFDKAEGEVSPAKATGRGTRKSTRATRYKPKTPVAIPAKPPAPRGRGRRSIFKRPPCKAPTATATVVTSDSLFYKGNYMQVGDIVSMRGVDGGTYYAQLRGFLTDQYCEKSAVVTWLLPTKASPPPEKCFDPATYVIANVNRPLLDTDLPKVTKKRTPWKICPYTHMLGRGVGPEEELPRKLDVMEFVMHAPSDYYKASNTPYPLTESEVNNYNGFIWTSIEAKERA